MSEADLETVLDDPLPYLGDEDPAVRRLALACCSGRLAEPAIREGVEARITTDDDGSVRAAAVELIAEAGPEVIELLFDARLDEDSRVVEAAATGMGSLGAPEAVVWLCHAAERHDDRLVREAAVAALGEIGDARAVPTLLTVLEEGPPQVRRRAVVALTVFDDPAIEPALQNAAADRNPMVREVAEMVVGRGPGDAWTDVELRPDGSTTRRERAIRLTGHPSTRAIVQRNNNRGDATQRGSVGLVFATRRCRSTSEAEAPHGTSLGSTILFGEERATMKPAFSTARTSLRALASTATAAMLVVAVAGSALAATETPAPGVVPPTDTDFATTVAVDQFDPANGTLTSVSVELIAGVNGDMFVENLSTQSAGTGAVSLAAEVTASLQADPTVAVAPAVPEAIETFALAICDDPDPTTITGCNENPDFAGPAGLTVTGLTGTDTQAATFTDAASLALFTGTGTVVFDVAANGNSSGIQDTGNVFFEFFTQASATVNVIYQFDAPAIDIEKATNGEDADEPTGPTLFVGDPVTWTYVVTNTGEVDLTDVTVTDDQGVAVTCPQDTLAVGESMTCTASGVAALGQYANVGTTEGTGPSGAMVTDSDPSHYIGVPVDEPDVPSIDIEKATNGEDADEPTGPSLFVGDPVTWTYVVTNTGDVDLTNVSVTDDQGVTVSCPQDTLAVGESMTCTASGTAALGQYANIGTTEGSAPGGVLVTDSDPSHYLGVPTGQTELPETGSSTDRQAVLGAMSLVIGAALVLATRQRRSDA